MMLNIQSSSLLNGCYITWASQPMVATSDDIFCSLYASSASAFWLDSGLSDPLRARWSYMGDAKHKDDVRYIYSQHNNKLIIKKDHDVLTKQGDIFDILRHDITHQRTPPIETLPCPFQGGFIGWFGYELRYHDLSPSSYKATTPDAYWVKPSRYIAIDHDNDTIYYIGISTNDNDTAIMRWLHDTHQYITDNACGHAQLYRDNALLATPELATPLDIYLHRIKQHYITDIEQAMAWIAQGESYQICLTNNLHCKVAHDPLALYLHLRSIAQVPYGAFIRCDDIAVLSASPEHFLQSDTLGHITTKPIKGTMKRHHDAAIDADNADNLKHSEKNIAENIMIVDLLRNDLSRMCKVGSVHVPILCGLESYESVHQLVSTITGTLRDDAHIIDIIQSCFPGGSMTGAPKKRAMELIERLEQRSRGVYSGSIGWLGYDGACYLNIVIRTIISKGDDISIGVGGGITYQSDAEDEYNEMLLKAQTALRAIMQTIYGDDNEEFYHLHH